MMRNLFACLLILCLLPLQSMAADLPAMAQLDHTRATLVSEYSAIQTGKELHVAVILGPKEGWHTYWENPGDAGMPTSLIWTLPQGFKAGDIDWPAPQHLKEGPLVTYAYTDMVFLPVTITLPPTLDKAASYPIKVKADWLVCKDICVPESAELQITLPVSDNPEPTHATSLFEKHWQHRPVNVATTGSFKVDDKTIILSLPRDSIKASPIDSVQFSIREQNLIHYAAEQTLTIKDNILYLILEKADDTPGDSISGILSVTATDHSVTHYNVTFKSGITPAAAATEEPVWFPAVLLFALLGGLVLNLMPCVLPILSLKALAIAKKSGGTHEHVVQQGIAYTLGILLTFTVLAGILISLRMAGESVGWGYQMQSPAFVGFLIYLLFLVGLSLSGVFHLPVLLGNVGGDITNETSVKGSFFTGILATAVATPCTAPFMASAVGAALTMPPLQALLVFEALGLGLAAPFLIISLFPALRRFLPKPGAWMDTFRQLIAFPMYGSVIWLMWVLTLQTGVEGMVMVMTGMLMIVIVIWMKALFEDGSKAYTVTALAIFALILALSLPKLGHMEAGMAGISRSQAEQGVEIVPYSKAKLDELLSAGKPVFVDATAAWCITCQVNARVALHTEATMKAFKDHGVTLMIADWTRHNDAITEFLSSFGYKGVPLCVFYPAGGKKPVVMPQILTETIVINAISGSPPDGGVRY